MALRTFYTFNQIITTIQTTIGNTSASLFDFSPGSNIQSIIESFAYFIEYLQLQINLAFESFFLKNVKGTELDNRVGDYNIKRKNAAAATGPITFSRDTPAPSDFVIPQGATVSTQPDVLGGVILYVVDNNTIFPSGASSVSGKVSCSLTGIIGNQPSGSITDMPNFISGIDSVTNPIAFTDGANEETDEQLKTRVPLTMNGLKRANKESVLSAALSIPGISLARLTEGQGNINVFVSNQTGVVTEDQKTAVFNAVDAVAAFGVDVIVVTPSVKYVTLALDIYYLKDYYNRDVLDAKIRSSLFEYVVMNTDTTLKLADLIMIVMKNTGVTNVRNFMINNFQQDAETTDSFGVIKIVDSVNSIKINYFGV